ncbi:MAG: BolA/IbaG family iron-sulfur metabolism protein [Myxococcales bacterium FL481]|nr:MAG: BolA/IbaG family iron-sulfur metabolism protein [Myxococcales bacterium FL481]
MRTQQAIEDKLHVAFEPVHMEVVDDSHRHNVPSGAQSHFRVLVVSDRFEGQSLVARHRAVNDALAQELAGSVHALGITALTPQQYAARGGALPSAPPCRGGTGQ